MSGSKISSLVEAMKIMIHSLPQSTKFNIVSFGSNFELLFPESVQFNENTFKTSLEYVEKMKADFGGTSIVPCLNHIFNQPSDPSCPRYFSIFFLFFLFSLFFFLFSFFLFSFFLFSFLFLFFFSFFIFFFQIPLPKF